MAVPLNDGPNVKPIKQLDVVFALTEHIIKNCIILTTFVTGNLIIDIVPLSVILQINYL